MAVNWSSNGGIIGTGVEGQPFYFFFAYDLVPPGEIILISGELPPGLTLNSTTGELMGTLGFVPETKPFQFTLRVTNVTGLADRSFTIIVSSIQPYWITPPVLVENTPPASEDYKTQQVINHQLQVFDPGKSDVTFELVSGSLPNGVTLREDGLLTGFIANDPATYMFGVKANASQPIVQTFQLTVLAGGDRPPFWSTLPGWLGDVRAGWFYNFDLRGADADLTGVTFTLVDGAIPLGLTLSSSGILTGTPTSSVVQKTSFSVNISSGGRTILREFFIRENYTLENDDIIIVPPVNPGIPNRLGTLQIDEDSSFKISAIHTANWVRYELTGGSMPPGLSVNTNTGEIVGTVLPTAQLGVYSFTIRAYTNLLIEDFITLTIQVAARASYRPYRVSSIITGQDRWRMSTIYNSQYIPYEDIFRPDDKNFGITKDWEVRIQKYIQYNNKDEVYNVLKNMMKSRANPHRFRAVPVVASDATVICEALLLEFNTTADGALEKFTYENKLIEPATFDSIRNRLHSSLVAPANAFEKWQNSYYQSDIQNDLFISNNHGLVTGKIIYFTNQNIPSPFLNNTVYYILVVDANRFRVCESRQDAFNGNYIRFNVNDSNRSGVFSYYFNAIPIVYTKLGRASPLATWLNANVLETQLINTLYLQQIILGPTSSKDKEDMELMVFDNNYLRDA